MRRTAESIAFRKRALELLTAGKSTADVATTLGASDCSVRRLARGAGLIGSRQSDPYTVMTHDEIAHVLGVSSERVRQIERSALRKLASNAILRSLWR